MTSPDRAESTPPGSAPSRPRSRSRDRAASRPRPRAPRRWTSWARATSPSAAAPSARSARPVPATFAALKPTLTMIEEGGVMRTFLIAAFATLALAAPAAGATRNFGITGFEKVRVEGPFKVILTTGVAPFARAKGSAAALDRVAVEVRGNTLVVHSNLVSGGGFPDQNAGPVEISLGTHDLTAAWMSGAGTLAIK